MEIKVLGMGCPRCRQTAEIITEALIEKDIQSKVEKVENINEIMKYGVMFTPAVVINEKVKVSGRIPNKNEVMKWIDEEK